MIHKGWLPKKNVKLGLLAKVRGEVKGSKRVLRAQPSITRACPPLLFWVRAFIFIGSGCLFFGSKIFNFLG